MSDIQERPLTAEEKSEFRSRGAMALKNLSVTDAEAPSESVVQLVNSYVDKWQTGPSG